MSTSQSTPDRAPRASSPAGAGRLLVAVYGLLALAATARSLFQVLTKFESAPLAYSLSGVSGLVYILATVALALSGRPAWRRVAFVTISFELVGVLVVGSLTVFAPELFAVADAPSTHEGTVWGWFGRDYGFVPLVLPVLGLWWLARDGREAG